MNYEKDISDFCGGSYFGHEYARIVARTEYDIYRYLNDRKMHESFKKALSITDKDKEDFESSFWTVASTWRRDYDEGDSGSSPLRYNQLLHGRPHWGAV